MTFRLLITGASGFIGKTVCEQAILNGYSLNIAMRKGAERHENINIFDVGDINRFTNWSGPLHEVDVVIHLAARVHVMNETANDSLSAFRSVNVDGTINLAMQAAAAGIKRFIYISSIKVNGEYTLPGSAFTEDDLAIPKDAYGQSKHEAELLLQSLAAETGMEVVIIRPPLVYGPGVKANFASLLRVVNRGWPLPFGAVNNKRSLVALDNLVNLIIICIHHTAAANQVFLVSDGQDLSIAELVQGISNVVGIDARLLPIPVWALNVGAKALGKGAAFQRLCGNLQVDITKVRTLLGWVPPLTVAEGLRRAMGMST